jgi:hypothetical protein
VDVSEKETADPVAFTAIVSGLIVKRHGAACWATLTD